MPQRQTYFVSLPPAEALARVATTVDVDRGHLHSILGVQGGARGLVGRVRGASFWISRPLLYRYALMPLLYGHVEPSGAGARIDLHHREYRLFKIMLSAATIGLLVLCLPLVIAGKFDPLLLAPLVVFALGLGIVKLTEVWNRDVDAALDHAVAGWFADVLLPPADSPGATRDAHA